MITKTVGHRPLLRDLMALLVIASSCAGLRVIDLTFQLKEGESITWPTNPRYNFTIFYRQYHPEWHLWLENNKFAVAEHTGTHVDAPAHIVKGRWRMQQIPARRLVGPGIMVDVKCQVKLNSTYQLSVDDLQKWEVQHGKIPKRAVVLVNFGWARRYPDWYQVFNTDNLEDAMSYAFPSVSSEAADWLVKNRKIIALGTDTPTADNTAALMSGWSVHEILLGKDILLVENVANVNLLPAKGFTVIMGGLKIFDGSGAPMRMLALKGRRW